MPSSLEIDSGQSSATFTVMTTGVPAPTSVMTTATLLDSSLTGQTLLRPARLVDAYLLDDELVPGMNGTLRAVFDGEVVGCGRDVQADAITMRGSGQITLPPDSRAQPGDDFVDIPVRVGNSEECEVADLVVMDPADGSTAEVRVEVRGINDEVEFVPPFVLNAVDPQAVVIADMTGDGFADIMSGRGGSTPGVEMFVNDRLGRFPEDPDFGYQDDALSELVDLAAADVVLSDGLADAILLNRVNPTLTVLENRGDSFERVWSVGTRVRPLALAVGDINGDEVLDYVVTSETDNSIETFRGTAIGPSGTGWVQSGPLPADVVLGHFNDDGFLDAATACFESLTLGRIGLHMGTAAATLGPPTFLSLGAGCVSIVVGDWNADGRDDLAVSTAASEVVVYLNDGGAWLELDRHMTADVVTEMHAADAEADGDVDIFFALDDVSEAGVLLNTGCGLFDPPDPILLPVDAGPRLAVGLLNRDDRMDVVLTRPADDELIQVLQVGEPCATYIVMTVHGQDGQGFNPFWDEDANFEPHGWPNGDVNPATNQRPLFPLLEKYLDQINYVRVNRGVCPVRLLTHEFDWVAMTGRGQRSILASRVLWMTPPPIAIPPVVHYLAAAKLESAGRAQTRTASREASKQLMDQLEDLVEQARYLDPTAPIFIDIVCHSRGTTVTSEMIRQLMMEGPQPLGDDVSLSVSYVSVIERVEPFLGAPIYRHAGNLMGDPSVDRHATLTRIAHFYEERACFASDGGVCVGSNWFDNGFVTWLLKLGLGFAPDILLELAGFPRSIGDESLSPDVEGLVATNHNSIIAEFTHIDDVIVGDPTTIPEGPSTEDVPVPAEFNFAWTSYFGDLMVDPTTYDIPEATGWPGAPVRSATDSPRGPGLVEFFADPTFDESKETVDTTDAVLADPIADEFFAPEIERVGEDLLMTCGTRWPVAGVWAASRPDVRSGAYDNDAYAEFVRPVQLRQVLDEAAGERDQIDVWIEYEFLSDDGFLSASYSGVGIEACEMWVPDESSGRITGRVSGQRLTAPEETFGAYRGDRFVLWGHDVRVYRVTSIDPLTPCPGDANGDGLVNFADLEIVAEYWGTAVTPGTDGDVDQSGFVDFRDLEILLDAWGTSCRGS